MYEDVFCQRLTELRVQKGVSARDMSLSLGQSESYINRIENRKMLPSMTVFFYICDYLGITPQDFFCVNKDSTLDMLEIIDDLKDISPEMLNHLSALVKNLRK